jgi:hypothetical protein
LRAKKPKGLGQKLTVSAGMIGQSSGRVMWWMPKVYQSTTSVCSIGRLADVHSARPRSVALWTTNSVEHRRQRGARHELVGGVQADAGGLVGVDDLPGPLGPEVHVLFALGLGAQRGVAAA